MGDKKPGKKKNNHAANQPANNHNIAENKITEKFRDIHAKNVMSAKKHQHSYESSSEEETAEQEQNLYESVFKNYQGNRQDLERTQQFLEESLRSGSEVCLICIGSVKRTDPIWSCSYCYCFFHLKCIQRWGNDSMSLKRMHQEQEEGYYNNRGEYIPKVIKPIFWDCPKCRTEYEPIDIPRHYECFCKKGIPENHLWLLPHSCGEVCGKLLEPKCGHKCVLLCHPGPCPPCPQTISISCKCQLSKPKTIRCSQKTWTCNQKCPLTLACDIHLCQQPCHGPNECQPCKKKSMQKCLCGNETKDRNCFELEWQCKKICDKIYDCGLHRCEKVCHKVECGKCPRTLPRSCPCGKEIKEIPCSEEVGACGDTCQKLLACEQHRCEQRCHKGNCSPCMEFVEQMCRCGQITKSFTCSKILTCEIKCKNMRQCHKHACNRKCCGNQCPPCDKICGGTRTCGRHKCQQPCHQGQCYPCSLTSQVKCRCGKTTRIVACGREKKTKPPKCSQNCRISSKCHHDIPHRCHFGDCPKCVQTCGLKNSTTQCEHPCEARCHEAVEVLIKDKNFKPIGPWDVAPESIEIQKQPHPPCNVKVPVMCIGGHEVSMWPCCLSKPVSCGRICGRKLKCGNHICQKECHTVKIRGSLEEDESCEKCTVGCQRNRPIGCVHPCKEQCHLLACKLCYVALKSACHCGLTQIYYQCNDIYNADNGVDLTKCEAAKNRVLSCGNRCIKNLPCGHRCTINCHTGNCPADELCTKKSKVFCNCKNLKTELACHVARNTDMPFRLECNDDCKKKNLEKQKLLEEEALKVQQAELEKNQKEIEEFEKKFAKKKPKEKRQRMVEETNESNLGKWILMGCVLVSIVSIVLYYTLS